MSDVKELIDTLSELAESVVAFIIMIGLAIIAFYFTVFVVGTGSTLAGYAASPDFVVLAASLLVSSTALAGVFN